MVSEDQPRGRPGRKLTKKRRESRRVSLDIPERFKDGADADEDVTASKRNTAMSMNQSIFSMIARAGQQSQTDLGTMVEEDSEDSDPESKRHIPLQGLDGAARLSRISSIHDFHSPGGDAEGGKAPKNKHRRALSENKLLRSLPRLKVSGRKESKSEAAPAEQMSSSQFLPPRPSGGESPKPIVDEPPLRHKSRATPGEEIHVEKRRGSDRKAKQTSAVGLSTGKDSVTLAKRLQEIFEFGEVEDVISGMLQTHRKRATLTCVEYPCWLLQSILLQGYMYITQKHICFYAYIPRKHVSDSTCVEVHR
jgi:sterol 3beta-glucosyltransferase